MSAPCVHHVGIDVHDETLTLRLFHQQLGFSIICTRLTNVDSKWVLRKNNVTIVVTKHKSQNNDPLLLPSYAPFEPATANCTTVLTSYINGEDVCVSQINRKKNDGDYNADQQMNLPHFSTRPWNKIHHQCESHRSGCDASNISLLCCVGSDATCDIVRKNSVYEVCLEVKDVKYSLQQAINGGALVLRPLTVVESEEGTITYAVVQSSVGNIQHTIIDTANYHGRFLPGFDNCSNISASDDHSAEEALYGDLKFDHVTLCVYPHQTLKAISWYQRCFGMHRLIVNKNESYGDGLMLNEIEMRLAAMSYWRCAEDGVSLDSSSTSVKFVIVESVSCAPNQVTTFLKQHGGPGIQHIGLITDRLVDTVKILKQRDVPLIQPPREYYNEIGKLKEITDCGESVEILEDCGILLDSEADCGVENEESCTEDSMNMYLMQIFSKPIFGDDTFFLEFLQRHGAQGFGAGNITALWKAVRLYMQNKDCSKDD